MWSVPAPATSSQSLGREAARPTSKFESFLAQQLEDLCCKILAEHVRAVSVGAEPESKFFPDGAVVKEDFLPSVESADPCDAFSKLPPGDDNLQANDEGAAVRQEANAGGSEYPLPPDSPVVGTRNGLVPRGDALAACQLAGDSQSSDGSEGHQKYHLLEFWVQETSRVRRLRSNSLLNVSDWTSLSSNVDTPRRLRAEEDWGEQSRHWVVVEIDRLCQPLVAHPNSRPRLAWNILAMCLIAYDIFWTPLQAFQPASSWLSLAMDWVHIVYWSVDLPLQFLVGHFHDGRLVTDLVKVAKAYLRTWFFFDVSLVTLDWIIVTLEPEEDGIASLGLVRMGKVVRAVKMLRVFRLLRLIKLRRYMSLVEERIQSRPMVQVILGICKLTLMILIFNHFIACLWWFVGVSDPGEAYTTWVDSHDPVGRMRTEPLHYRYTTSLHWSITQFTPAGMEVYATNPFERLMSIIVIFFALVTFSSFVSAITNGMNNLRNMNDKNTQQLLVFQRFIRTRKISTELSVRMRRHLEHVLVQRKEQVQEQDVELLKLMSEPLRMELHMEVYTRVLDIHPFFRRFSECNTTGIRKLCHTAIEEVGLSRHDLLFSVGDTAAKVFFVQAGNLSYALADHPYREKVSTCSSLNMQWLCEACLWTEWLCHGDAVAFERSVVLALDAKTFREVVRNYPGTSLQPAKYALLFVQALNATSEDDRTDLRHSEAQPGWPAGGEAFDEADAADKASKGPEIDGMTSPGRNLVRMAATVRKRTAQ